MPEILVREEFDAISAYGSGLYGAGLYGVGSEDAEITLDTRGHLIISTSPTESQILVASATATLNTTTVTTDRSGNISTQQNAITPQELVLLSQGIVL